MKSSLNRECVQNRLNASFVRWCEHYVCKVCGYLFGARKSQRNLNRMGYSVTELGAMLGTSAQTVGTWVRGAWGLSMCAICVLR